MHNKDSQKNASTLKKNQSEMEANITSNIRKKAISLNRCCLGELAKTLSA